MQIKKLWPQLKYLIISNNRISDIGAAALAEGFSQLLKLTSLNLDFKWKFIFKENFKIYFNIKFKIFDGGKKWNYVLSF
jgi:hypothetical protein